MRTGILIPSSKSMRADSLVRVSLGQMGAMHEGLLSLSTKLPGAQPIQHM